MADNVIPAWINLGTLVLLAALVADFAWVFYTARNASLLVNASGCGRDDESSTRRCPRAALCARPTVPLLDDRIVSITSAILVSFRSFPRARPADAPVAACWRAVRHRVAPRPRS